MDDDHQHRKVKAAAWELAPVYTGLTSYEPLADVRNILITGGAGFIHLVTRYPRYHIVVLDKLDYCATLNNTRCLDTAPNFTFCFGDITQEEDVLRVLKQHRIDTVFHFAAQSHVDLSFGNSFRFTRTNVMGTEVMLACAVKVNQDADAYLQHGTVRHRIGRFVHVSTDEVMGEVGFDDPDLLENAVLAPTNPYSASKAAAEMYVNAYAKSFRLPVIIVRSNNVYGPHQFPEKIIPKFACLLARGQQLTLHGSGENTRHYLYAGDAADAFDTILHRGKLGEIYNVDSSDEISNLDLASKLMDLFGIPREQQTQHIERTQDRPFNDRRYAVNGDKLRALGWQQQTTFEDGLKTTIEWYRQHGLRWWGDIEDVLTPFPTVHGKEVQADIASQRHVHPVSRGIKNGHKRKASEELEGHTTTAERPAPRSVPVAS